MGWHGRVLGMLRFTARSLWRHRLRTSLSMLGIVCGVVSVMALIGIGEGAKQETLRQIEQLGTRNILARAMAMTPEQAAKARALGSDGLSMLDVLRLGTLPGVSGVGALREINVTTFGQVGDVTPPLFAVTQNYLPMMRLAIAQGRTFDAMDYAEHRLSCIVGSRILAELEKGQNGTRYLRIGREICVVIGTLKPAAARRGANQKVALRDYDHAIFVPLGSEAALAPRSGLSEIIIEVRSTERVLDNLPVVRRVLSTSHRGVKDYELIAPQELIRQAEQAQSTYDALLGGIALLSMIVGGVGIMNIMLVSVTERTREIGLRRALGATRRDIAGQFLAESVLLTLAGGLIGVLVGAATVHGIASLAGWPALTTPWAIMLSLLSSLGAGLLFGWYPAQQASRLDPIAALRHD